MRQSSFPEDMMALSIEITRPDDLLRLRIEARNMRVDPAAAGASLIVDDAAQPAFLLVHFPPQAIAERAYYEATIVHVDPDPPPGVTAPAPPTAIETPGTPGSVPVRIAQGSRLVFKVPAPTRIPLTIQGLLDWSGLELSVNGIAAIGPNPTPAEISGAPAIAPPAETETALELPYRLIVSPTADVRWGHRLVPFTSRGRTELWHTRMEWPEHAELTLQKPASLRAIWSDDYNSPDGLDPNKEDPDLTRAAMSPNDRHQIVVKTSAFHGYEGEVTLTLGGPIGVAEPLAAAGGGPAAFGAGALVAPREHAFAGALSPIIGAGIELKFWASYVPTPFLADQLMLSSLGGWLRSKGNWSLVRKAKPRFRFEAIDVNHVLGQFLRNAGPRDAAARVRAGDAQANPALRAAIAPIGLEVLGHARAGEGLNLDLSEWAHTATQGRDHYVRIVYEGELLPFHNRAALVKVTERKFMEQPGGLVVAHLYQRNFIVVREPEKRFEVTDYGMPFKKVRLTTLVTPDIAIPKPVGPRSFWVEVNTSLTTTERFPFHVVGTDVGGNSVDFTIPMLFLSLAATGDSRQGVIDEYNKSASVKAMAERSAKVPGQKMLFAPRDNAAPNDNALLVTRTLTFALRDEAPQLLKAEVNVPQVQQLLGTDAPTTIRLYPDFVDGGLDAGSAVFAEVVKETPTAGKDPFQAVTPSTLGVAFSSDQAGGFATPNMGVSVLTGKSGPLAGKVADAIADKFDPTSFFPAGTAQLFGTFDLFSLLVNAAVADGAPRLQTESKDIAGGKLLVATLEWISKVQDLELPPAAAKKIASFNKSNTTQLEVHGRIEKPLTFDASGAPVAAEAKSSFKGTLNDFSVTLLESVKVSFTSFGFVAQSGAKPSVTVNLDSKNPLEFTGDLKFVEELRKAIPPDLFGKGPSLDLLKSPPGIRAGFSFALPPISVGVFALKDVSLGAGLTLPFLDGRPSLDFNVSERPHPFLLSVGIFGGGGFFHLQVDTAGLKIVEAALEFGATASVDLGVASGGVHIMAGIYFKLERKEPGTDLAPTLTGYLRMGGYLSVLGLIKISLEFTLSFTYDGARDKAYGRATLTVKVEVALFSASVDITVERAFGGSGDPPFGKLFSTPAMWIDYAEAFA